MYQAQGEDPGIRLEHWQSYINCLLIKAIVNQAGPDLIDNSFYEDFRLLMKSWGKFRCSLENEVLLAPSPTAAHLAVRCIFWKETSWLKTYHKSTSRLLAGFDQTIQWTSELDLSSSEQSCRRIKRRNSIFHVDRMLGTTATTAWICTTILPAHVWCISPKQM